MAKTSLQTTLGAMMAAGLTLALLSPAHAQNPAPGKTRVMLTPWSKKVSQTNPLPEYPRPQLVRKAWQSLNGQWDYATTSVTSNLAPGVMTKKILVPFVYESVLSGVGEASIPNQKLWYRRTFTVPTAWKGQKIILNFGAVNYDARVWVNGAEVGAHKGGFDGFSFDISSKLRDGANEIMVSVINPLKADVPDAQVLGKQRIRPSGIFYTGATGIWQTVWLEPVPANHIETVKITPDIDSGQVRITVNGSANAPVKVSVLDKGKVIATAQGTTNSELPLPVKDAKLWTPDTPYLYDLTIELGDGKDADKVSSYFAMRKISLGKDAQNRNRILLNNKFVFQVGALDQGYWSDGIFTAPTDEALRYDIVMAKKFGYNLLRKHAKVEPARWYYHTDKLGMLVWQDMPQMFEEEQKISDDAKKQFRVEWEQIINEFYNYPSIVVWTTFNEGWGQHDTPAVVDFTRKLDPTRLVNNASGWTDKNVGDMHDTHAYPGPGSNEPEANRAAVNGEFGGVTLAIPGHRWTNDVMGYGATLQSSWLATKRFQDLMKKAYELRDSKGTSAVVYTQLTDVEQEINGILTYDRAVTKMDTRIVTAANQGNFLPLGPNPDPEFVPTASIDPITWRYTMDTPPANWTAPDFIDSSWKSGAAPFGHDIGERTPWRTSDIWIRRDFTLPTSIPKNLQLLVKHDEDAEIYINGVLAAKVTGYTDYEPVAISPEARATMKPGKNTFAVHCHQTVGGQGIDVGIVEVKKK